jgi:dynein regulatory complex protein 1
MISKPEEYNNDKEERKKQRKKKMEKGNSAEVTIGDDNQEKGQAVAKTGSQQAKDSLFNLDNRKHTGLQDVTSIRVVTNDAEAKRRVEDENLRRSRLAKLQQEALASAKANAAIEMKWAELLEKDIPQELNQEIRLQMDACHSIIQSKDDLIKDFQLQLRAKDEEYVRMLRRQSDDIDELLARIRREFQELYAAYENEFSAISDSYMDERARIIAQQTGELEQMFDHRKNKEVAFKEDKQKREEDDQRNIDELITRGANQYNKLKVELELNIQALKQQLEEIHATYELNTVKLEYNFRVLTEQDAEKKNELALYRRKGNKLKGQLNLLVTKFTEMEAQDKKINDELTEDYRGLTLKYKDLQAKFRHFEIADTTKYDEVWTMHEEEVKDKVDQLLKADKIITEQVLGLRWKAPDMHALQKVLGRYGSLGQGGSDSGTVASGDADAAETTAGGNATAGGGAAGGAEVGSVASSEAARLKKVAGARVRAVLKMLALEAGFMVNPQVVESLNSLPSDDADISRAEAMLKALGVKTEQRLNSLVKYFFVEKEVDLTFEKTDGNNNDDDEYESELLLITNAPEDVVELRDIIKPEDVIAAVKAYLEDVSVETGPVGASATGGGRATQEEIRIAQKRLSAMRNYWQQLSQLVSDEAVMVWAQLEKDMTAARDMLIKRSNAISEVDALNAQNGQLKSLLNQYLGDTVTNAAYKVPPAHVMKVRDLTGGSNDGSINNFPAAIGHNSSSVTNSKTKAPINQSTAVDPAKKKNMSKTH